MFLFEYIFQGKLCVLVVSNAVWQGIDKKSVGKFKWITVVWERIFLN